MKRWPSWDSTASSWPSSATSTADCSSGGSSGRSTVNQRNAKASDARGRTGRRPPAAASAPSAARTAIVLAVRPSARSLASRRPLLTRPGGAPDVAGLRAAEPGTTARERDAAGRARDRADDDDDQVEEEFRSLLEGLRTTLPGRAARHRLPAHRPAVRQVRQLVRSERVAYYLAFVSALVASLLLTAPSSHQRLRARDGEGVARRHRRHLDVAVRLTVVGSVLFAVAITAVAFLVSSIVLGTGVVARRHDRRRASPGRGAGTTCRSCRSAATRSRQARAVHGRRRRRLGEQVVDHRR